MKTINMISTLTLLFALVYSAGQLSHDIGYEYAKKNWVNPRGESHG